MPVKVAAMGNSSENSYSVFSLLVSILFLLCCHNTFKNKDAELIFVRIPVNGSAPKDYEVPHRHFCVILETIIFRDNWLLLAVSLSVLLRNILMDFFSISLLLYYRF